MGRRLVFAGPRSISFQDYSEPRIDPNQVRVETLYSGISHGTEMNVYRGTAPFYVKKWNPDYRIFLSGMASWNYPKSYGYEQVCRITEVGESAGKVGIGDIVCTSYGHQSTAVLNADGLHLPGSPSEGYVIPEGIDPILGVFHVLSNVALNGVHRSAIQLGDKIAVFGLGVMGLLVTQFAKLSGAETLIAVDLIGERLRLAEKLGADITLNPLRIADVGMEIKKITNGGVDIAFESSGSNRSLNEAVRSCARRTKVIALGWYQGGANDLFLGDEFHHNEISIIPNLASQEAVGERWCAKRIKETFFNLVREGKLNVKELITHTFPFSAAPEAYKLIDEHPDEVIKCVLTFTE